MSFLFNPRDLTVFHQDPAFRELIEKTIAFFEDRGKAVLKEHDRERVWYDDFLGFIGRERVFATLLTPPEHGGEGARWDTSRNAAYSEVLAFYGLCYWYTWQVSILGLGPLWMSPNEGLKKRAAKALEEGGIFAFGLSEKEHGADIYASDMVLSPKGEGAWVANGGKYYIGNANKAAIVSTFGKIEGSGDYVFFAADPRHPAYTCVKNVVNSQSFVAEYKLSDYPVAEEDILSKGRDAWDAALNTINVGKYNLGWGSIGICTHAMYEAIDHASHRRLFDHYVTDFPHIQRLFTDAYARLVAMKLFALRAADYMRSASAEDRRYLLYNPMVKMKVTTQGEEVIDLLWDVIAAKGFEKDMVFESAARDIRALPKLEGTVHVNMALIIKFMGNYFMNPGQFPEIPARDDPAHDAFLFCQGPTKGLGRIQFHDYKPSYESVGLPNVKRLYEQIGVLTRFGMMATPDAEQQKDIDFLLTLGELFTITVYGQLILESARLRGIDDDVLDTIFGIFVRDFSRHALALSAQPSSTEAQQALCAEMIRKPAADKARFERVWKGPVQTMKGAYAMKP